jgi:hypothetical protein
MFSQRQSRKSAKRQAASKCATLTIARIDPRVVVISSRSATEKLEELPPSHAARAHKQYNQKTTRDNEQTEVRAADNKSDTTHVVVSMRNTVPILLVPS